MKLLWKLLRQHISKGQFAGFAFANLFGMIIVLTGYQFYNDVLPVFTGSDSFMKANYIMVSKSIGTGNSISGRTSTFSVKDIEELGKMDFTKKVGPFTPANYKTNVTMSITGKQILNSEIYFESVPNDFIEIDMKDWHYEPGEKTVPVILPRTYINMYNFGFARTHSLPQISEGLMGMIDMVIIARGNGKEYEYKGKIVAFSNSMTSVIVPQEFMDYTNNEYAPEDSNYPTRLLMEVSNPTDERLTKYFEHNGLEMESEKLKAEKTTYFLRLVVSMVMVVGIIISVLSFYILMLSIYLLVQKNTEKLQNLILIGYRRSTVALPYQLLTMGLNILVLLLAILAVIVIRAYYIDMLRAIYPDTGDGGVIYVIALGTILFMLVTLLNTIIIRRKINNI